MKYYKEHPRCKNPTYVAMADFNKLKREYDELERSYSEDVGENMKKTVQELTESKSNLRKAYAAIVILEGKCTDKTNLIAGLGIKLSTERTTTA